MKKLSLTLLLLSSLTACKKKPVDPLKNVAGVYTGTASDAAALFPNAKANVTVSERDGRWFVNSVGITGPVYQVILTRGYSGNQLIGSRNGFDYVVEYPDMTINGNTLNLRGRYDSTPRSSTRSYIPFSFTGTR